MGSFVLIFWVAKRYQLVIRVLPTLSPKTGLHFPRSGSENNTKQADAYCTTVAHAAPPAPPPSVQPDPQLAEGEAPPSSSYRHHRKPDTSLVEFWSRSHHRWTYLALAFRGCSPSQWCAATEQQLRISLSAGSWHAAGFTYSLEGLFPSVRPDVIVERCSTSKGSAAVATLEGSVTGVRDDVVPQLRGLGEGLGAVTTLVGPAGERETPCRQCIPWPKIRNHVGGGGFSRMVLPFPYGNSPSNFHRELWMQLRDLPGRHKPQPSWSLAGTSYAFLMSPTLSTVIPVHRELLPCRSSEAQEIPLTSSTSASQTVGTTFQVGSVIACNEALHNALEESDYLLLLLLNIWHQLCRERHGKDWNYFHVFYFICPSLSSFSQPDWRWPFCGLEMKPTDWVLNIVWLQQTC